MNIYILNTAFEPIAVIDCFKSLIWTKRYYSYGDFELYIPADNELLPFLQPDFFVTREDDSSVMVIEKLVIQTDTEDGNYFIVSGRSAESILLRRIFDRQFIMKHSGSINVALHNLLSECTTMHHYQTGDYRKLPVSVSLANPIPIVNLVCQFTGQTLLDGMISICKQRGVGLKMVISGGAFLLIPYEGSEVNVIFSPDFDNLMNSRYSFDKTNLANHVFVAGEGEGSSRVWSQIIVGTFATRPSGLALHELFVDARDISSNNGTVSNPDYDAMLSERGHEKLANHDIVQSFEAEVETRVSFQYKVDYDLGDIVTVTNEYGVTAKPRIVEIIESWSETGYTAIPTFDALDVLDVTILRDSTGAILRDSTGAILTVRE